MTPGSPPAAGLSERVERLLAGEIAFIHNPEFCRAGADRRILEDDLPELVPAVRPDGHNESSPAYFAQICEVPLLTANVERQLFRKMNFLKFRANQVRVGLDPVDPDAAAIAEIENRLAEAGRVRDRIISANLRLVVSIARRFVDDQNDFDDLISDGNVTLMNAVEKFDYSRGFRFSTYATHAIQREYYRQIRRRRVDRSRFVHGVDKLIAEASDEEVHRPAAESFLRYRKLAELMADQLDEREQFVLAMRFGLNTEAGPQPLRVIGLELGVSKERVRQLEQRAIAALQRVATPS